jgi:UDP-N-acetyl-D-mannosaminuronic acid dehydrogenase
MQKNKIAVFGLGYVGLPLALSFAMKGSEVYGVDVNPSLVDELKEGITYHLENYNGKPINTILREQLDNGRFAPTLDAQKAIMESNIHIVTVGLPVSNGKPVYSYVESACREIAKGLKKDDLVIIRSTVVPGTTKNFVLPILEESGMKAGVDFYLGYSSERIAEGKAFDEFENMPTLASGINEDSANRVEAALRLVTKAEIFKASSMEVVEIAKVLENLSRDINIAMSNEFAVFTKAMGIDIFEVIQAANTHKRVQLLTPGPGVGGYCIPNAYHYLTPKAEELNVALSLSTVARGINIDMPLYVAQMVLTNLPVEASKAKVAVLGIAMKDYSPDDRYSPALDVISALVKEGIEVKAFDPAVPTKHAFSVDSLEEAVSGAHGIVILAKQEGIDFNNFKHLKELMSKDGIPFIIDTKHTYNQEEMKNNIIKVESI